MTLRELIVTYYNFRGYKWPTFEQAMQFAHTEIGEVYELILAREGGWVRNNPDSKPKFDKQALAKELGDAIMMLMVAGLVEGVDPIQAMTDNLTSKMGYKQATLFSPIESIE